MHQKFVPDFVGCIVVKMALLKEIISCVGIALTSLSAAIRGKKKQGWDPESSCDACVQHGMRR